MATKTEAGGTYATFSFIVTTFKPIDYIKLSKYVTI